MGGRAGPTGRLDIRGVRKAFGQVEVLKGVDIAIEPGEFFTLLGPSGCGKTTLLRILAGFHPQDAGTVVVDGTPLDGEPAHRRDVGMVFQDYALFPHLSVADNIAFGLKARRMPAAEIAARVAEGLRMVRLDGLGDRMPAQLSGGQQQRVGLARAMAIRPRLLLMDEPLSNLDAKLRLELREDIRDIQRRLGITTIYVTHDQEEALAISDRICVMNAGVIEQVGAPFDIYRAPVRRFAASFVGTMNFLPAEIRDGGIVLAGETLALRAAGSGPVEIAFRPEHARIGEAGAGIVPLTGAVRKVTFLGREAQCTVETAAGAVVAQIADPGRELLALEGRTVTLALPLAALMAFDPGGDLRPLEARP